MPVDTPDGDRTTCEAKLAGIPGAAGATVAGAMAGAGAEQLRLEVVTAAVDGNVSAQHRIRECRAASRSDAGDVWP
ncbi:hypothetical protein [Streptomyces sp900116325]|uniref:hypothetical protein n=1 Tax=Streptomyces sp. 900116325 TaxID=3154295 RepID=UPI0033D1FA3C